MINLCQTYISRRMFCFSLLLLTHLLMYPYLYKYMCKISYCYKQVLNFQISKEGGSNTRKKVPKILQTSWGSALRGRKFVTDKQINKHTQEIKTEDPLMLVLLDHQLSTAINTNYPFLVVLFLGIIHIWTLSKIYMFKISKLYLFKWKRLLKWK